MNNQVEHINPTGLIRNSAFSQIVTTHGNGKTVYIGGQNAVNGQGEIVGKNDIGLQTQQVMENVQIALLACDATFENLIKLSIYVVQGNDLRTGFAASQKYLAGLVNPPTISVLIVSGLANPDFLVEIEAIAFIPE